MKKSILIALFLCSVLFAQEQTIFGTLKYGMAKTTPYALNGAATIDWGLTGINASCFFTDTLNANRTIAFTNVEAGKSITVYIEANSSWNITWSDATIDWTGDVTPTQTPSGQDIYEFICPKSGKIIGSHIPD